MNASSKEAHLLLLNGKGGFTLKCSLNTFSLDEQEILHQFGHWFDALTTGELQPLTDAQKRFVLVTKGQEEAVSEYEKAWFHYLKRCEIEAKKGSILNARFKAEDDEFYSREGVKQLRKSVFSTISSTHRGH